MKKKILSLLIILIILIYPVTNLKDAFANYSSENTPRATPTDILGKLSDCKVEDAQKNIKQAEKQLFDSLEEQRIDDIILSIEKGELSYRNILKDVCIVGDSLMNGLEAYNILNSNNLITQVSASLYHLSDNIPSIIRKKPEVLVLHYGLNMVEATPQQPARFIRQYEKLLGEIKEALPGTRIIVSSIFPVDTNLAKAKRFERIDEYNKALKEMCAELSVEFLDNGPVFIEFRDCYAYDGIHLDKNFYQNGWLKHLVKEKEII